MKKVDSYCPLAPVPALHLVSHALEQREALIRMKKVNFFHPYQMGMTSLSIRKSVFSYRSVPKCLQEHGTCSFQHGTATATLNEHWMQFMLTELQFAFTYSTKVVQKWKLTGSSLYRRSHAEQSSYFCGARAVLRFWLCFKYLALQKKRKFLSVHRGLQPFTSASQETTGGQTGVFSSPFCCT